MRMERLDVVALLVNIPHHGLRVGDLGTIVLEGRSAFAVEFIDRPSGQTRAIVWCRESEIRVVDRHEHH